MNTVIHECPQHTNWRDLYRAAIFELDSTRTPNLIATARRAGVQRARELLQQTASSPEERQALDWALCCLQALDNVWRRRRLNGESSDRFDRLKSA
jgi:uncharacterized membrane protein YccC